MENRTSFRKTRTGRVISSKNDKTITVLVEKRIKHPLYNKFVLKSKKYRAHDENNECQVGDTVQLMETRPLSKTKRWRLVEVLERAK
jgi:small subunit ribosomal protein S17